MSRNTTQRGRSLPDNVIPLPAPARKPIELRTHDGKRRPDALSRMLRLHLQKNNHDADNAYLPFREVRRPWPLALIVAGLVIAVAGLWPYIF